MFDRLYATHKHVSRKITASNNVLKSRRKDGHIQRLSVLLSVVTLLACVVRRTDVAKTLTNINRIKII